MNIQTMWEVAAEAGPKPRHPLGVLPLPLTPFSHTWYRQYLVLGMLCPDGLAEAMHEKKQGCFCPPLHYSTSLQTLTKVFQL